MPHLPGDETWIDRTRPHDAGERRRQRARPRPLWIGDVKHHQIGGATGESRGRREAADECSILGALKQIAARVVAGVQQKIGAGDALCEGAGRRRAFASRAPIAVRGGGEIRDADCVAIGIAAKQILDACAICPGRVAEDTIEPRAARLAPCGGERILTSVFIARRNRLHGSIDQCDLRREKITK